MLLRFPSPLVAGTLIKRYKRFLADVALDSGETVTTHCCNLGSMLGLTEPGARVWLSRAANPKRKLRYSWELIEVDFGRGPALVGINPAHPNTAAVSAISTGLVPELAGYAMLTREVRYADGCRIDILLEAAGKPSCYVEVKNVHLMRTPGRAEFPDSVTARGVKHLAALSQVAASGARAVMLFLV